MPTVKENWTLIKRIRDGHSYWRRDKDRVVGIADGSGTYPENCEPADRPPLLLDHTRPIVWSDCISIPLKRDDGTTCATPVGPFEAVWVAQTFNMEIVVNEKGGSLHHLRVVNVATYDVMAKAYETLRSM